MAEWSVQHLRQTLQAVGIRPTPQRLALGCLLFAQGHRHVTAELLYEEARQCGSLIALATVYNTLHQFTAAGLIKEIAVPGPRAYFDTNTSDHHHCLVDGSNHLVDAPDGMVKICELPAAPEGMIISRVDVIVRLRRATPKAAGKC